MLSEQERIRIEKLESIKAEVNPYPEKFETTHELSEISLLPDETKGIRAAGRIMLMRKMGKMSFITISDIEGKFR